MPPLDTRHRLVELGAGERLAGRRAGWRPAPCGDEFSASRLPFPVTTYERVPMEPGISPACRRADRTLAGSHTSLPKCASRLGVVVVTLDLLAAGHGRSDPLPGRRRPVHHLPAVEQGEVLRPPQVADVGPELVRALDEVGEVRVRQGDPPRREACATLMCLPASLLPTPRDPECRNSHTRSFSSRLTSMKWFREPSEPSCSRQFGRRLGALGARHGFQLGDGRRCGASRRSWLYLPADIGMPSRSPRGAGQRPRVRTSAAVNWRPALRSCRSRCRRRPRPG